MRNINCVNCGGDIEPVSPNQKYCKQCGVQVKKERTRQWFRDHKEYDHERCRKFRKEHPEYERERHIKYAQENPELVREQKRKWYYENLDKESERMRKWGIENPEKRRVYVHNRNARIKGNGGKLPPNVESLLFEAQDGLCYLCGKPFYIRFDDAPSIEHKIPISRGGRNDIHNVALAHLSCNLKKARMTDEEFVGRLNGL